MVESCCSSLRLPKHSVGFMTSIQFPRRVLVGGLYQMSFLRDSDGKLIFVFFLIFL